MLSPETWNFQPPESNFITESEKPDYTSCIANIRNFSFAHIVSVVLPGSLQIPTSLSDALLIDCEYYTVANLSISELISIRFIEGFIKKGYFQALSLQTRIDCDDCACVTPNGLIILSLTKDTFQTLGLQGKLSHFSQRSKDRYICLGLYTNFLDFTCGTNYVLQVFKDILFKTSMLFVDATLLKFLYDIKKA